MVVVVDDRVTSIGSINFDPRSFSPNAKCAAVILDDAIAPNAMRVFRTDLGQSRRVRMDDVRNRGLANRVADCFYYWIRAQV